MTHIHSLLRMSPAVGLAAGVAAALLLSAGHAAAAPGAAGATAESIRIAQATAAAPAPGAHETRTTSMPAKGLFIGDQLSPLGQQRLTDFIVDIVGQQIEVVLVIPRGPWKIDDTIKDEYSLTPARLASVKKYLRDRGVDPGRIFVESRIDDKIKEPRLDVQSVTRPGGG